MDLTVKTNQEIPRGVRPHILLSYVRLTASFLFSGEAERRAAPYREILKQVALDPDRDLSHCEYFAMCVAAHYATVATFVPTDVDNQIRFRLWNPALPTRVLLDMTDVVIQARRWDPRPVSTRWVLNEASESPLSGHDGEWFSIAAGAYGALRKRAPEAASVIAVEILDEIERETRIFEAAFMRRDGIEMLKVCTLIAHNLGDLDRVIDMWGLDDDDPLKKRAYRSGHDGDGMLAKAGRLNKALMADENHRHFALRKLKCLRTSHDLLLPFGPFFDDWGRTVAKHPSLSPEQIAEVAEALVDGWCWLYDKGPANIPTGYGRAIAGIIEHFPGGQSGLCDSLPSRIAKRILAGPLHQVCAVPRHRFEEQWRHMALKIVSK